MSTENQNAIGITAVAVTRKNDEGELYLDWLLEGGIAALEQSGVVLLATDGANLTGDDGHGEVYTTPQPPICLADLVNDVSESAGILQSLIDSIESKGNYSAETTVTFLHSALSCLMPFLKASLAALDKQAGYMAGAPLLSTAAQDVLAERNRQITAEGWTPAHDDLYCAAELPRAAAAYILNGANDEAPAIWPFASKWWKPRDARSNYVRAGALILAEVERLDRAAAACQEQQP